MDNEPTKITREQLYKEIWEIAVTGVSKKYNVPYSRLIKLCKDNDIPTPPAGYWTSVSFGKPVVQIPLPESAIVEILLSGDIKTKKTNQVYKKPEEKNTEPIKDITKDDDNDHEAYQHIQGAHSTHNIYKREVLYQEVWEKPVVQVAQKYGVSDVTIHKVCKSLNIPVPPRGYWAKISAGEKAYKTPLPPTKGVTEKIGKKGVKVERTTLQIPQGLSFLSEEERNKIFDAAANIKIREGNERLHKKIAAYKFVVNEWNNNDRKPEGSKRDYKGYSKQPPFLAGVVSKESLPRVYRLLDALYCEIEKLGGFVNDDLSLLIRNEHVTIYVEEAQDEIKHEITKQEARALIEYKDATRHGGWASEPKIRKYDHVFNGKLRIYIRDGSRFRDTDTDKVESRLGQMLISLYEESEVVRKKREAWEEANRKREEEEQRREERRERYNKEVESTIELRNKAADFQIACSIRSYIEAVKENAHRSGIDEAMSDWIEWAQKKADWYDPVIARDDEFFGIRAHEENAEKKTLNTRRYWY